MSTWRLTERALRVSSFDGSYPYLKFVALESKQYDISCTDRHNRDVTGAQIKSTPGYQQHARTSFRVSPRFRQVPGIISEETQSLNLHTFDNYHQLEICQNNRYMN